MFFIFLIYIKMQTINEILTNDLNDFNTKNPNGSIVSTRIMVEEPGVEVFKTTITPDCSKPERYFTGYAKDENLATAQTMSVLNTLALMK